MPWQNLILNDGSKMPSIAYGHNYWVDQEHIQPDIENAMKAGFTHFDTAQGYYDEDKFAAAFKDSGKTRDQLYITTKWSRADTDIKAACENSLRQLGVDHVDLYLIHGRSLCGNDIQGCWEKMELVKTLGYTKSIGVSNFDLHDLKTLISNCRIIPCVNQIQLDPHSYAELTPLIEYCAKQSIIIEGYSTLQPIRYDPLGPIAKATSDIAERLEVEPEQVLLAWVRAKGAAVVTSSSQKSRMHKYITSGDIILDPEDIYKIDQAGAETAYAKAWTQRAQRLKQVGICVLFCLAVWRIVALYGLSS